MVKDGTWSERAVGGPIVDCAVKQGCWEEKSFELKLEQSKDPDGSRARGRIFLRAEKQRI